MLASRVEAERHYVFGVCNICGNATSFYCPDNVGYRGSLVCWDCRTTSRYRSIARGILRAVYQLAGVNAASLVELREKAKSIPLRIYDTQAPFYTRTCSYPIPDLLLKCGFDVQTSRYKPGQHWGKRLNANITNQNLEALTFPDSSFDIVITSDVMEHVRLDYKAHREIRRVLRNGGIYLFTVPHFRDRPITLKRVTVNDPSDPTKDEFPVEKQYHVDGNSEDGRALVYREYGTDLDAMLIETGFTVDYCSQDFPEMGIIDAELFFCQAAHPTR